MAGRITLSREEIQLLMDTSVGEEARNRYRAMVLEDAPGQLDQLVDTLYRQSFDVDRCRDWSSALGLCHQCDYDLVVAGYRSEGIDGVSFLARVRNSTPGARRILVIDRCEHGILLRAVNSAGIHGILGHHWPASRIRRLISKTIDTDRKQ
ncbi:MAG: hypothetical protein OQL28_07505 [Sedimenticola sp.]|nr:hypothetical protein [Sedimenticola sp.]